MKPITNFAGLAFAFCIVFAGAAAAQESKVVLKEGPGKEKAMQCVEHMAPKMAECCGFNVSTGVDAPISKNSGQVGPFPATASRG